MNDNRTWIALLVLSAAGLVGIALDEGYTARAVPDPVKGRAVPTVGFGSTGKDITMASSTTPPKALARALADVQKFEGAVKECITVPLHQREYDAFINLAYNIGAGKSGVADGFCYAKRGGLSTLAKRLNAQDYAGACDAMVRPASFARVRIDRTRLTAELLGSVDLDGAFALDTAYVERGLTATPALEERGGWLVLTASGGAMRAWRFAATGVQVDAEPILVGRGDRGPDLRTHDARLATFTYLRAGTLVGHPLRGPRGGPAHVGEAHNHRHDAADHRTPYAGFGPFR